MVGDGLKGFILLCGRKQQIISKYANDSLYMVRKDKQYVDELVRGLECFSEALRMRLTEEIHLHRGSKNTHTSCMASRV